MFCTNGVLLRMLTGAGRTPLAHVTHLVRALQCGRRDARSRLLAAGTL